MEFNKRGRGDRLTDLEKAIITGALLEGMTRVHAINARLASHGYAPVSQRTIWTLRNSPTVIALLAEQRECVLAEAEDRLLEILREHGDLTAAAYALLMPEGSAGRLAIREDNVREMALIFRVFLSSGIFLRNTLAQMSTASTILGNDLAPVETRHTQGEIPIGPEVAAIIREVVAELLAEMEERLKTASDS